MFASIIKWENQMFQKPDKDYKGKGQEKSGFKN